MSHKTLRIGLIGAGGISHFHLPYLLALGADVYVYSAQGAPELVAEYGGTVVDSLDKLLERVDYVDITTPTYTHFEFAKRAIEAGKNVISEKPLVRTAAELEALQKAVIASGCQFFPAHVVRFFPEYERLKEAVDSGVLGELAVLRFSRSGAFPTRTPWFADRALSGGIIMDQMIHDLDIARWVAGEVVQVSAVSSRTGDEHAPIEAAHVLLTHEGGAISHIAGMWGPAHLAFTTEYSVTGTKGMLEHASSTQRNFITDLAETTVGGEAVPDTDPVESPYFLQLREFMRAFTEGEEPRVTFADGVAAVNIALAALESLETGQPVDLRIEAGATL